MLIKKHHVLLLLFQTTSYGFSQSAVAVGLMDKRVLAHVHFMLLSQLIATCSSLVGDLVVKGLWKSDIYGSVIAYRNDILYWYDWICRMGDFWVLDTGRVFIYITFFFVWFSYQWLSLLLFLSDSYPLSPPFLAAPPLILMHVVSLSVHVCGWTCS